MPPAGHAGSATLPSWPMCLFRRSRPFGPLAHADAVYANCQLAPRENLPSSLKL